MNGYDAIIIGTGQAGPSLAERLATAGRRVCIIERGKFGGTCVNNGCTPTKTLVASAYVARLAQRAADYGVELGGPVKTDMARVKARKDALVEHSTKSLEKWLRSLANTTVYTGHARFLDAHTVTVGPDTLTGDRVFIDVGGRPNVPNLPGVEQVSYLTSESMMDIDFLPEHLLIVGGSYVGLEFGQMYGRGAFTHTAYNDYEIVADNLLNGENRKVSDRIPIYGLFTDPPLGRLGMSEAEARRAGYNILIGRMPMTDVARAREKGETQGFMKVLVDENSKQILGAAVLGVGGDEAVHSLVDAMNAHLPYRMVEHGVRIHPTVSELIPTVLGELTPIA